MTAELAQIRPKGARLAFALDPENIIPGGGVGGWDEIGHAKQPASTEFAGTPLRSLSFTLPLEGWQGSKWWARRDGHRIDVEETYRILQTFGRPPKGQEQPPVLEFSVSGLYRSALWVLNGLDPGSENLRGADGRLLRLDVGVTLLEYRTAAIGLTPAQRVAAKPPAAGAKPSGRVYVVKAGDSLQKIAQRELGKASRWVEIKSLNRLKSDAVRIGQRLRLPA